MDEGGGLGLRKASFGPCGTDLGWGWGCGGHSGSSAVSISTHPSQSRAPRKVM